MDEPFHPPSTGGQWSPPAGPSGPRASFGRRLAALVLDYLIVGVAGLVVVVLFALIDDALVGLGFAFWFAAFLAYSIYFVGGPSGQTPGRRALGIRVIDFRTGGPIGYGRAALRYVGSLLSGWLCYLGYLWMLWDGEKQTWHDKMANSVVVPTQYYPVDDWP